MNRYLACGLVAAIAALAPATADAFPCGISRFLDHEASGDNHYGSQFACRQDLINFWWEQYDFDQGDWDEGFGYENPCGYEEPLARTFHALYALHYSDANPPSRTDDFSGTILQWAGNYANREIDELDGVCRFDATSQDYRTPLDDYTELYPAFFYDMTVPERAGTLLHEARHAGGSDHPSDASCGRGGSCNPTWGYNGANTYEVLWLWHYVVNGVNTTNAMRRRARNRANHVLDMGYTTHPGFHVEQDPYEAGSFRDGSSWLGGWCSHTGAIFGQGDFNRDGKTDLYCHDPIVNGSAGNTWVALSSGRGTFYDRSIWLSGWCSHTGATFGTGDYDGDGRTDLYCHDPIVNGSAGNTWIALSTGMGFYDGSSWLGGWCSHTGATFGQGDFNGDRKTDLYCHDPIVNGSAGNTWIALSNGRGFYDGSVWLGGWCSHTGATFGTGDYNGDGKTDLYCHDPIVNGSAGNTWIALSNGRGFYDGSVWLGGWCSHTGATFGQGDFNGDGKTDLFCKDPIQNGSSGYTWVALSNGGRFYDGSNWSEGWCSHTGATLGTGDFNGDRKTDFTCHDPIVNGSAGNTWVQLSTGSDLVDGSIWLAGWCSHTGATFGTGDFDGDRKSDLYCHDPIVNGSAGNTWIAVSDHPL